MPERYGPGRSVSVSLQVPDFVLVKAEATRLGVSAGTLIADQIEPFLQSLRTAANLKNIAENPGNSA